MLEIFGPKLWETRLLQTRPEMRNMEETRNCYVFKLEGLKLDATQI